MTRARPGPNDAGGMQDEKRGVGRGTRGRGEEDEDEQTLGKEEGKEAAAWDCAQSRAPQLAKAVPPTGPQGPGLQSPASRGSKIAALNKGSHWAGTGRHLHTGGGRCAGQLSTVVGRPRSWHAKCRVCLYLHARICNAASTSDNHHAAKLATFHPATRILRGIRSRYVPSPSSQVATHVRSSFNAAHELTDSTLGNEHSELGSADQGDFRSEEHGRIYPLPPSPSPSPA